jgi:phospholipid/cholesterol/gamma-HCH transport system substrate-binding protein
MMRRLTAGAFALALMTTVGGCSAVGLGPDTNKMTVYFAKTPSLYEQSRVKIMGANVGTVDKIEVDGTRVKATLSVDSDVPVPADVHAAIVSVNTIGERNVVLYPPWKPGMAKAKDGLVIPQERTDLPVEIDEALTAFTDLSKSIDSTKLQEAFRNGAGLVKGHGEGINDALKTIGDLTSNLAAQDQRIVSLATRLNTLAISLNNRDEKLKALFRAFNDAGGMLADERNHLQAFLSGLDSVIKSSAVIVQAYTVKLPSTVATLSEIVLTLKANSGSLSEAITSLAKFSDVAVEKIWDKKRHLVTVRLELSAIVRAWLQPLFTANGWGRVPCADPLSNNCENAKTANTTKPKKVP